MLEKLKTHEGTLEVISVTTSTVNLSYNINSHESDEIIQAFDELYKALKKVNK